MAAGLGARVGIAAIAVLGAMIAGGAALGVPAPRDPGPVQIARTAVQDADDVLGANAACLVCHLTFVKEELTQTHQKAAVACTKCHGPSVQHANDEDIGASKPDIVFPRERIDAACMTCHKGHDAAARDIVARLVERRLPREREPACTDCHGTHRIDRTAEAVPHPPGAGASGDR